MARPPGVDASTSCYPCDGEFCWSVPVCELSTDGKLWECDLDRIGTSSPAPAAGYIVTSGDSFCDDHDHCAWGTVSTGHAFYCTQDRGSIEVISLLGTDGDISGDDDTLSFWYNDQGYDYWLFGSDLFGHILGRKGDDNIIGSPSTVSTYKDRLWGQAGNDKVRGHHGDDELHGGPGDDILDGREGNDSLYGDDGNDQLWGYSGNDRLYGDIGEDLLCGQEGIDYLAGEGDDDALSSGDDSSGEVENGGPEDDVDECTDEWPATSTSSGNTSLISCEATFTGSHCSSASAPVWPELD